MATNVKGYAFGVKHAARAMQRNPGDARKLTAGAIVNIASTSGLVAQPGFVPYSMTKAAVMQLSRCAALDLSKHGIRCVLQECQAGNVLKLHCVLGCAWWRSRTVPCSMTSALSVIVLRCCAALDFSKHGIRVRLASTRNKRRWGYACRVCKIHRV